MSTCPNCGSEYADGASCVVCGHPGDEPAAATELPTDAVTGDEPAADPAGTGVTGTGVDAPARRDDDPVRAVGAGAAPDTVASDPTGADDREATTPPGGAHEPVAAALDVGTTRTAASMPTGGPGGTSAAPPPPDGPTPPPPTAPAGPGTALQPPSPDALPVTESERNWGMVAHLSSLVAAGIGGMGFLGPLVVWLVKKDDSRFVRHHAVEALNFNLSLLLYTILMVAVGLTIVGLVVAIPAAIIGVVLWFVASIVAAVKAQRGEGYRYPLTIRLVKE